MVFKTVCYYRFHRYDACKWKISAGCAIKKVGWIKWCSATSSNCITIEPDFVPKQLLLHDRNWQGLWYLYPPYCIHLHHSTLPSRIPKCRISNGGSRYQSVCNKLTVFSIKSIRQQVVFKHYMNSRLWTETLKTTGTFNSEERINATISV